MGEARERWVAKAVLEGLVFALVVAALSAAFGPLLGARVSRATQPPTCSDTRGLTRIVPTSVRASSHRQPEGALHYDESKLVDGDSGTAWVEGAKGLGIGEHVTFEFARPIDVRLLCVVDGYANTWTLYRRNPRVRGLDVVGASSSKSVTLVDAGTPEHPAVFQEVPLAMTTAQLELTITSAYAGSGADRYTDTSISEIEIWNG